MNVCFFFNFSITPVVGTYFYAKLFDMYLDDFPGCPFAGGSAICVLAIFITIGLDWSMKKK